MVSTTWICLSLFLFGPGVAKTIKDLPTEKHFEQAYNYSKFLNYMYHKENKTDIFDEIDAERAFGVDPEIAREAIRRKLIPNIIILELLDDIESNEKIENEPPIIVEFLEETIKFPAKTNAKQMWERYRPIIDNYYNKKQNEAIIRVLSIAILPPLFLLIVGVSLAWVISGFRSSKNH